MPKHSVPDHISPTCGCLPVEIKQSTRDSSVEAVVLRNKTDKVNANITIAYK